MTAPNDGGAKPSAIDKGMRLMRWAKRAPASAVEEAVHGKLRRRTKRELVDLAVGDLLNAVSNLRCAEGKGADVASIRKALDGEAQRLMSKLNAMNKRASRRAARAQPTEGE